MSKNDHTALFLPSDSQPAATMNNYSLTLNTPSENGESLKVDLLSVKKASLILRAVNHKLRQQILKLIDGHGKMTVTEIYIKLKLEQSVASQHLAILRKAGFVKTDRDGKFIYYSVNASRLEEMNHFIEELLN
jgi:DNA-binding transcriptional ArsR family regulator